MKILTLLLLILVVNCDHICQFDSFEFNTGYEHCPGFFGTKRSIPFGVFSNSTTVVPAVELDFREESNDNASDTKYYCTSQFATDFDCQISCIDGLSLDYNCDGDVDYCLNHTCTPNADCFCNSTFNSEVIYVLVGDVWQQAEYITYITIGYTFGFLQTITRKALSIINDTEGVYITLNDRTIKLVQPQQTAFLRLTKGGYSSTTEANSTTLYVELPYEIFDVSGYLYADLVKGDSIIEKAEFKITRRYICEHEDCSDVICSEAIGDWRCANTGSRVWAVISITILSLLTIWAICACTPCWVGSKVVSLGFISCKFLWWLFSMCWNIPKSEGSNSITSWIRDKGVVIKNKWFVQQNKSDTMNYEPMVDLPPMDQNVYMGRKRLPAFPLQGFVNQFLLISNLFLITNACQDGLFIPVQTPYCTAVNASFRSCSVSFSFLGTLPYPGSKGCYTIGDKVSFSDNLLGNVYNAKTEVVSGLLGRLEIEYVAHQIESVLDTKYYTSSWRGTAENRHRCFGHGPCDHNKCENQNPLDVFGNSQLSGESTLFPGITDCQRSCGCVTCGCSSCTESCTWTRGAVIPQGDIYKVSSPGNTYFNPYININLTLHDQIFNKSSLRVNNQVTDIGDIFIEIIGTLESDPVHLGENYVLTNGNTAWVQEASQVNNPSTQRIGDIQASTPNKLSAPNANSFIFSDSLWTKSRSDKSFRYHFRTPGISLLSNDRKLPMKIDDNLWHFLNGNLMTNSTNPGALIFRVATKTPIVWVQEISTICPEIDPSFTPIMEGCYDCPSGAVVKLRMRSTCEPGTTGVYIDEEQQVVPYNLVSHSVDLKATYEPVEIYFKTNQATLTVKFEVGVASGVSPAEQADIVDVDVTGTLNAYIPEVRNTTFSNSTDLEDQGDTPSPNDVTRGTSGFGRFAHNLAEAIDRAFLGGASWVDRLIAAAAIILGFLVIVLLLFIIYKIASSNLFKAKEGGMKFARTYIPYMPKEKLV